MGCCVSTPKNNPLENNNNINPHHQFQCVSKSPPRAEEEAVKEVLSETPKPRPKPKPRSRPESPRKRQVDVQVDEVREDNNEEEEEESMMKPKLMLVTPKKAYLEQKTGNPYPDPSTPEEISEVSEICSFSETISTSTLKEDDDLHSHPHPHHQMYGSSGKDTASSGETRQHRVFRSQGYNGNFQHIHYHHPQQHQNHVRSQGKSPARRRPDPESSPARKRPPGQATGPRREAGGDSQGRRSQSSVMRANNVGRSPSGRKTGPSPGRARMVNGPESGSKGSEDEVGEEGRRESEEWQGPNESLENPLVSLECFIFL